MVDEVVDQDRRATMGLKGPDLRDDPFRLARAGLPGLRRRAGGVAQGAGEVRHRAARPAVGLRPVESAEGQQYLGAMRAAANYAWANRQLLMWQTREIFAEFFGRKWEVDADEPGLRRGPQYRQDRGAPVDGRNEDGLRASQGGHPGLPAGHPEVPERYRPIGQPVIIPGDMGRASWVLVGQPGSMERTFGTTCHGAGRVHQPHGRRPKRQGPADRSRTGRRRESSPSAAAGKDWPKSSRPPTKM